MRYIVPIVVAALLTACSSTKIDFPDYAKAYEINNAINSKRDYTYADMPKGYSPNKVMSVGDSGNCADFAVLKCVKLIEAGIDPKRLTLHKFLRKSGVGHAVCVIDKKWAMDWGWDLSPFTPEGIGAMKYTPIFPYTPNVDWKNVTLN